MLLDVDTCALSKFLELIVLMVLIRSMLISSKDFLQRSKFVLILRGLACPTCVWYEYQSVVWTLCLIAQGPRQCTSEAAAAP